MNRAQPAAALAVALLLACGGPTVPAAEPNRTPRIALSEPSDHHTTSDTRRALQAFHSIAPERRAAAQHDLLANAEQELAVFAEVLADGNVHDVGRQAAAWVLGEVDDPRACNALSDVQLLTSVDAEPSFQVALAVALSRCQVHAPLRALLADGIADHVRLKAAIALGLAEQSDASIDIVVLRDELPESAQEFATIALALLGDAVAGERLRTSLDGALPQALDIAAVFALALARSGPVDARAVEVVREATTRHPDPIVREAALAMLVEKGDPYAATRLTMALQDPSPRVAARAARWLDAWEAANPL